MLQQYQSKAVSGITNFAWHNHLLHNVRCSWYYGRNIHFGWTTFSPEAFNTALGFQRALAGGWQWQQNSATTTVLMRFIRRRLFFAFFHFGLSWQRRMWPNIWVCGARLRFSGLSVGLRCSRTYPSHTHTFYLNAQSHTHNTYYIVELLFWASVKGAPQTDCVCMYCTIVNRGQMWAWFCFVF